MTNTSYLEEVKDTVLLASLIKEDGWVNDETILVNLSPSYSSIMGQILQHQLGSRDLHDMIYVPFPHKGMSQVWDHLTGEYPYYDKYIQSFITCLDKRLSYLFFTSYVGEGKMIARLSLLLRNREVNHKIACLYSSPFFKADYMVEERFPPPLSGADR